MEAVVSLKKLNYKTGSVEHLNLQELASRSRISSNKPGTAQIGAISKAQN